MKTNMHFAAFLLLAMAVTVQGQTADNPRYVHPAWNRIALTGDDAKILTKQADRFSILITAGWPGRPEPQSADIVALQEAIMRPEIFGQLFERLGGEFMLGDHTGAEQVIRPATGSARPMPGLQLGYRSGRRFGVAAGIRYYRLEWSGAIPVTVFPMGQSDPQVRMGTVSAQQSGLTAELLLGWQWSGRTLQPFIRAGLRASLPLQDDSGYELAGVQVPWKAELPGRSLTPAAAAGLRVEILKNLLLEAGVSGGRLPGSDFCVLPEIGIGVGL